MAGDKENFQEEYSDVDPLAPPPEDTEWEDPRNPPRKPASDTGANGKGKKTVKKEINPKFKDVRETGRWGEVSKKEIMAVGAFVVAIVIAVIVVAVIFLTKDKTPADLGTRAPVFTPTMSPSMQPAPEDQLASVRNVTEVNPILATTTLPLLLSTVAEYQDLPSTAPAVQRAMAWLLFNDPAHEPADSAALILRFALAVLYFNNGGEAWTTSTNWLSGEDVCTWYGVECDRFGEKLEEIDLTNNNLVGTVPNEVNYFQDLRSLWMRRNALTGTIPALALGQLPVLTILYLEENQLSGGVDASLRTNGVLSKFRAVKFRAVGLSSS
jgi:hypothetical protein